MGTREESVARTCSVGPRLFLTLGDEPRTYRTGPRYTPVLRLGFPHGEFLVQIEVQEKHVDARLSQKTQLPLFGVGANDLC